MKTYNDYPRFVLGYTDIGSIVLRGIGNIIDESVASDGKVYARVVPLGTEIAPHYSRIAIFSNWVKIYDDDSLSYEIRSDFIDCYRSCNSFIFVKYSIKELEEQS